MLEKILKKFIANLKINKQTSDEIYMYSLNSFDFWSNPKVVIFLVFDTRLTSMHRTRIEENIHIQLTK